MSQGYVVEIDGGSVTFEPHELKRVDLPLEHTVANEWEITTPFGNRARGHELSDVDIYYRDSSGSQTLIYQGEFDYVSGDPDGDVQTLRGEDLTTKLKHGGVAEHYQNIATHEAIQDYWDSHTNWSATVSQPTVSTVDTDLVVQEANTTQELIDVFGEPDDDEPLRINDDRIELLQSCWVFEAEDHVASEVSGGGVERSDFSGGEGFNLQDDQDTFQVTVTPDYDIPEGEAYFSARQDYVDYAPIEIYYGWSNVGRLYPSSDLGWDHGEIEMALAAGESYTFEIRTETGRSADIDVDVIAVYDDRQPYDFDNEVHEPDGYLDGPGLYPNNHDTDFGDEASSTYNIETATLDVTTNDIDGVYGLALDFDGSESIIPHYEFNSSSFSASPEDPTTTVQGWVSLARYSPNGARNQTPRYGYDGQEITSLEIRVDTNDLPVIENREYIGNHYENLTELHEDANYAFVPQFDSTTTQSVESFQVGEETGSASWRTLEGKDLRSALRDYRNKIRVVGNYDDDDEERVEVTVENEDEIAARGEREAVLFESGVDSRAQAISVGRSELQSRLNEDRDEGTVPIIPKMIDPGKIYYVPEFDENLILESVQFTDGSNPQGRLEFGQPKTIERLFGRQGREIRRTKTSIR